MTVDISKGVALLDEKVPGWWSVEHEPAIDLERLELESPQWCVCGQLYGHDRIENGIFPFSLFIDKYVNGASWRRFELAFDFSETGDIDEDYDGYQQLTDAWRTLIQSRRDAARETTL